MIIPYYEDYPTKYVFGLIKNLEREEDSNLRLSISFVLQLIVLFVSLVNMHWFTWFFYTQRNKKWYTLHYNYLSNENYSNCILRKELYLVKVINWSVIRQNQLSRYYKF